MKHVRIIVPVIIIIILIVVLVSTRKTENFTLPDANPMFAQMCPQGYKFVCISKSLPGIQTQPPLPPGMASVCPDTHMAACLPGPESIVEPVLPQLQPTQPTTVESVGFVP